MDANNDGKKKYFDIAPPAQGPATTPARPTAEPSNRQMINMNDDDSEPNYPPAKDDVYGDDNNFNNDTLLEQPESAESTEDSVPNPSFDTNNEEAETTEESAKEAIDEQAVKSIAETEPEEQETPAPEPASFENSFYEPENQDVPSESQPAEDVANETTEESVPVVQMPTETDDVEQAVSEPVSPNEDSIAEEASQDGLAPEAETKEPAEQPETPDNQPSPVDTATISPEPQTTDENPEQPPEDKDVPAQSAERFAVTDSLPDPGQQASDEAKQGMQDPKVSDTKEYYVPIGQAHHKHGGLKAAFIFGIICAVIVIAGVIIYMTRIG